MGTKEIKIKVVKSDNKSNISAKIQVQNLDEIQGRSNVLNAIFNLEDGKQYDFSIEVRGTPGSKFEVKVDGAKAALHRKGEIDIPENGVDVISGDITV